MNNQQIYSESTSVLISPLVAPSELAQDKPLKLGIMASGSGTHFEAIAQAIADGQLNAKIEVLIHNNDQDKVKYLSQKWQVPAVLRSHKRVEREEFDRMIVEVLQHYQVEWVVMAGWVRIVTAILLDAFPNRVINTHPSLLPSFPGFRGVEEALESGVKITGCTVHIATPQVDHGKILIQAAVPILPNDTRETLHARILAAEHRILPQAVAIAAKQRECIEYRSAV